MFCTSCGKEFNKESKFCTNCGNSKPSKLEVNNATKNTVSENSYEKDTFKVKTGRGKQRTIYTIGGMIILVIVVMVLFSNHNKRSTNYKVIDNSQSVVNILCDNDSGGSGTIFSDDGVVLTNNHVVVGAKKCLITIPETVTGRAVEIYEGTPDIIPVLSEKYDIAGIQINNPYTDSEGNIWGNYSNVFSSFVIPSTCDTKIPSQLGDSVKIYGYPVTSGGYNLTVTDGIISSFDDNGNILTSAQVDSGNSGGLAIDQYGCWLGIPSAVASGDYQNLGVIIPSYTVVEFLNSISPALSVSKTRSDITPEKTDMVPTKSNDQTTPICDAGSIYVNAKSACLTNDAFCAWEYGASHIHWNGVPIVMQYDPEGGLGKSCACDAGFTWKPHHTTSNGTYIPGACVAN